MFSGNMVPWEPSAFQTSARSAYGLGWKWLNDGGLKHFATFAYSIAHQDMSQEKRWGMSWLFQVTPVYNGMSSLRKALPGNRVGAAWIAWCCFLQLGLLPLVSSCIVFLLQLGFSWISKHTSAPGVAAGCSMHSLPEKEPSGCCSPSVLLHTWIKLAIRYSQLTAETMSRNGRNYCSLPLQTLSSSCAGPLLAPERDPAAAWSGWGWRQEPCPARRVPTALPILLTEPKELAQWWWE